MAYLRLATGRRNLHRDPGRVGAGSALQSCRRASGTDAAGLSDAAPPTDPLYKPQRCPCFYIVPRSQADFLAVVERSPKHRACSQATIIESHDCGTKGEGAASPLCASEVAAVQRGEDFEHDTAAVDPLVHYDRLVGTLFSYFSPIYVRSDLR